MEDFWDQKELWQQIEALVWAEVKTDEENRDKLERILHVGIKGLKRHELNHRRFGPRQQFQQPELDNGDVLELADFSQLLPHTPVFVGVKRLVFKRCRLENCDLPEDAKLIECKPTHKSYCSHINLRLPLPVCPLKCQHVVPDSEIPELVVDGRVVLRDIYQYRNLPVE